MNLKFKKWVYVCLTLLSFISIKNSHAQCVELVNNGGFETITSTPTGEGQINLAVGWTGNGAFSTDLLSASSTTASGMRIPCNKFGYQNAHGGNAYAGILHGYNGAPDPFGWTENLQTTLSSVMTAGKMYEISFWISKADLSTGSFDNMRVDIGGSSNVYYTYTVPPSLTTDKTQWTKISFPYCATVGDENLINIYSIPNSYGTSSTATTAVCSYTTPFVGAYVYIDDVSVKQIAFSVPTQTLCAKQTGTFTAVPTCSTIVTSALTYTWNYGDGSSVVTTNTLNVTTHSYAATGTYTASLTVSSGTCSNTFTYNVIVPTVTTAITSNSTSICNGNTSFTATPNPAGTYTVSWGLHNSPTYSVIPPSSYTVTPTTSLTTTINFANLNQNVYVLVTVTSTLGCQYTDSLFMPSCCATPTNVVKYTNTTFTTTSSPGGTAIAFAGTITVNSGANLIVGNKDVTVDPNTKFILNGTGRITFAGDYVHGCNYMWDGIYAFGTSSVTISNSRVEDAKRVIIDTLGGATISVTGSYLNKNNMGIVFKAAKTSGSTVTLRNTLLTCASISTVGALPKMPTAVNLTNAATLGAFTSTVMLPPYNTLQSQCGIMLNAASHTGKTNSAITIGGTTGQENVFDKMQLGVYSYDSKSNLQNNVFQNFKSSIAPASTPNSGVFLLGPIFGAGTGSYLSAGGSVALKNTFRSNDYGLYNLGKSGIVATYNTFSVQTTGAYLTGNNNGSVVSINFNNFFQSGVAVNFFNNTYLTANVKNNNMNNTAAAVGTYNDNFAIRCTEATLATNPSSYPAFDIDNNNISGFYNGIYAANTLSLIATDNEVHMRQDNANDHWQNGICVTGSNANKVINNIVDMPSLNQYAYWQSGIFMALNQVPRVQCNSINNLAMSITFKLNNSTAATDGVKSNYMQNAQNGIWMHDNAVIGNQAGNTGSNSSDNVWATTCNLYTYTQGSSNPSSHIFFTRSLGSGYDLPNAKAANDGSSFCFSMVGNNSSAAATGTACIANTATPSNLKVAGNSLASLMQGVDDILTDFDNEQNNGVSMANTSANAADNSADNTLSLKAMNRRHLLYNLVLQNIDVQQDAALSGFMNSIKSNNTGLLLAVDSLIHQAEIQSSIINNAKQANTVIVASNLVEQSQQEFNTLYLEYLAQNKKLNPAQLSSMISIAEQCPSYYGVSVYQARTVLFDINKQSYRNACENVSPDPSTKRMSQTTNNLDQETEINVFPNPANNQLFVNANDYEQVSIKLYNIMGVLVADKIVVNNNSFDISNFANGVYTYKLYNNDTELKVGKLIITH